MARTISEIANGIKVDFIRSENLRTAYSLTDYNADADDTELVTYYNSHFSAVSVETCLIYVFSTCAAAVEHLFEWFTADVNDMINKERYGYTGWYEKMALLFRYGENISPNYLPEPNGSNDGDFSESDVYPALSDAEELESLQVVKYAYCLENDNSVGVVLKIAGSENNTFCQLTDGEVEAFEEYINRVKPAGIPVTVINAPADVLTLNLTIYYNPLVINSNGHLISDNSEPVKTSIHNYLNSIEFNGEFIGMRLVDAIQQVDGVDIVELTGAWQQHGNYPSAPINIRYQPYSGYLSLDDEDLVITYIPNN